MSASWWLGWTCLMIFYFCPHADILGNYTQLGRSAEPETNSAGARSCLVVPLKPDARVMDNFTIFKAMCLLSHTYPHLTLTRVPWLSSKVRGSCWALTPGTDFPFNSLLLKLSTPYVVITSVFRAVLLVQSSLNTMIKASPIMCN